MKNIQKSVAKLAAVVAVKPDTNAVTPAPDLTIATTSRRTVDISSLLANRKNNSEAESNSHSKPSGGGKHNENGRKGNKNNGS